MLFMSIYTYEPEKRHENIHRRLEKGAIVPQGVKIHGEWSDLTGGRAFRLIEVDDPEAGLAASAAWNDIGKIELVPVMETEEVMEIVKSMI